MATAVAPPVSAIRDEHVMDTRTPSPVQKSGNTSDAQTSADESYQPDLSNEVAMLSTKLINAINYQTNLDDSLQATRHELEQSRQELKKARAEKQSLDDAIAQGVLIKKSEVDITIARLRADLAMEKASRDNAEKAKRQTENELENLTSSLFEEANKMVAQARKDTEAVERRNSQLKSQIKDTEDLVASQQEQLQDLKLTMEKLERTDTTPRDSSVPTTPIKTSTAVFDAVQPSPNTSGPLDVPPNHPLYFSQILLPILRTDTSAYADFAELIASSQKTPHSRTASGNMASASQTNLATISTSAAAASSPNLPGAFAFASNSANSSPQSSSFGSNSLTPTLKESKFYKRVLVEDLEPTLRLDLAPGLSFLSRRTVQSSLLNGTLVVEPFAPTSSWKFYSPVFACALCGESRKDEVHTRKHRFRTSESEDAQRYPLCDYCLGRVRAAGDFVGFLRMVRDGHWRCSNEGDEKMAWEEAVKLRERMFWARIGGGVVPSLYMRGANGNAVGTPVGTPTMTASAKFEGRQSLESIPEQRSRRTTEASEVESQNSTAQQQTPDDVFRSNSSQDVGSEGIGKAIVNMSSRAASSAVPLQPHGSAPVTPEPISEAESHNKELQVSQEAATSSSEMDEAIEQTQSQEEQADASVQLQREADAAEIAESSPSDQVPPEIKDTPVPAATSTAGPMSEEAASRPSTATTTTGSRPSSGLSVTSHRELAPPPTPPSERRSSSSSVLARVRAMEAKGNGK